MELMKEIEQCLNGIDNEKYFFKMYPFANENINGYKDYFNLKNKSLLTVGSSGDQTINAHLYGCNDITVCDICPLTKPFYYLKLSLLLNLDRDEYLSFLCKTYHKDKKLLSKKTYKIVRETLKDLDQESFYLWEDIFKKYKKDEIFNLFKDEDIPVEDTIRCNTYIKDNETYNKIKKSITNLKVNFINENLKTVKLKKKYDNVWLSNVMYYLNPEDNKTMIENVNSYLKDNGKMLMCYYWDEDMIFAGKYYDKLKIDKNIKPKKILIPGVKELEKNKNSILVYEKKM